MTYKYEYKYSKEDGYTKVKIPKSVLKNAYPHVNLWWSVSTGCYVKDSWERGRLEVHFYNSVIAKALSVLIFPLSIFVYGWFEASDGLKRFVFDKKHGAFSSYDMFVNRHPKAWALIEKYLPKTIDV